MKYNLMVRKFGTKETGSWRSVRPEIDLAKCNTCGRCRDFCPDGVITDLENRQGVCVDLQFCKGCGICAEECKAQAIQMIDEP